MGVGANNQGQQDGKPVYGGGGACDVVSQSPGVQIPTTKYDWGVTRSLSGEERPAVRQTSINTEVGVFVEIFYKVGTVDVNLFKPVVSVCDVGTRNSQEPILSCWGFDVTDV